jgi:hypothetical protein
MTTKMNWIKKLFKKKEPNVRRTLPMFHIDKHYNDMNRRERREYKRWLAKHNMWDGAIVSENLERNNRLDVCD